MPETPAPQPARETTVVKPVGTSEPAGAAAPVETAESTRAVAPRRGTPPLRPLAEHPALVAACAAGGLLLGLAAAALTPAQYTAETRLAVGSGEMSNLNIPGYPTASAAMASNYARWVTQQGAGGQQLDTQGVELSASPIPESNVIRVEAVSTDEDAALRTADDAATALRDEVNSVREEDDPELLLQRIEAEAPEVAAAEQQQLVLANAYRGALQRAADGEITEADTYAQRDQYTAANARYEALSTAHSALETRYNRLVSQNTTEADLTVVQPAEVTGNDRSSNLQRLGLVGLVLGGLIGFAAAHLAYRRRRRTATGATTTRTGKAQKAQKARKTPTTRKTQTTPTTPKARGAR